MSSDRRRSVLTWPSAMLAGIAVAGCMAVPEHGPSENLANSNLTFEEWLPTVYREESGIWIVDGDTPIQTERELREFFMNHVQPGALVVHQAGGVDAKWNDQEKLAITYCVSTSFGGNHAAAVSAMTQASGAWEAAANVDFIHIDAQDANCTASNESVVFDVNPVSGQPYLARAFFPNETRPGRNVLIDSSSFGSIDPWTLPGILRHELGHTLGFRHEHTRPEAGTCFEDDNWRPLTAYDSASVMHYPQCNGSQSGDLVLTDLDKAGAASLYGPAGQGGEGGTGGTGGAGGTGGTGGAGGTGGTGAGGSGGTGGTPDCDHDLCLTGTKLEPDCDPCASQICDADPYCCDTKWDSICVGEVSSICGETCSPGGCVHDICVTGAKLSASCDACAADICTEDPYCCSTAWDSLCVSEVNSICGQSCG